MLGRNIQVGFQVPAAEEPPLFHSVWIDQRQPVWSLVGSMAFHAVALGLVAVLSQYLSAVDGDRVDWARYHVEPLRLHLAEPLFFIAQAPSRPGKVQSTPAELPAHQPNGALKPTTPRAGDSSVSNRLQLPASRETASNAPAILQPDALTRIVQLPTALPALAFWARKDPDLPKPPPQKEVVNPGRTEAPSPALRPTTPPVLAIPNRELVLADLNVSMRPRLAQTAPALAVPNSATTPVGLQQSSELSAAPLESLPGQAANVLALARERNVRDIEIPKELQNLPRSAVGDGSDTAEPHSGAASLSRTTDTSGTPGGGSGSSKVNGHVQNSKPAVSAGDASTRSTHTATSPDPGTVTTTDVSRALAPLASPSAVTRIEHPSNGSFDVVVMQSAAPGEFSGTGTLSGDLIYTVYLRVGDRKEWLLKYCLPSRRSVQSNPYEVNVGEVEAITPPYPIVTLIPNGFSGHQNTNHVILHGLLTETGRLRDFNLTDAHNLSPVVAQLLALLGQWRFRPAMHNQKPIAVEVLLVIPPSNL